MVLRSAGNQGVYIAPQADVDTPATTGFIKLRSFIPMPDVAGDSETYKPEGQRMPAFVVPGDVWSAGDIPDGRASYNEAYHFFRLIYGNPVTTTPVGGTLSRQHVWTPAESDAIDPGLYTLITGDATTRERFPALFGTGITMEWTRSAVTWGGSVMARAPETQTDNSTDVVIPGSATRLALVPVIGRKTGVWLDAVPTALGTTRLTRCRRVRYGVGDFHDVAPFLNETQNSFETTVNGEAPSEGVGLWVERGSNFHTLYHAMQDGTTYGLRVKTLGPTIEGSIKYTFMLEAYVQFLVPDGRDVDRRVVGNVWNCVPVWNETAGFAYRWTVIDTVVPS